jgi:SHS2 domain-containing protein
VYYFEEHTADAKLVAKAETFPGLIKDLVEGMLSLLETRAEGEGTEVVVEYSAERVDDFIVGLLEEILERAEVEGFEPKTVVEVEARENPYYAKVKLLAVKKSPSIPIKAVTYHQFEFKREDGYLCKVVFDL